MTGNTLDMFHMKFGSPVITFLSAFFGIMSVISLSCIYNIKPIKFIGENSLLYFSLHQTVIIPIANKIVESVWLFQISNSFNSFFCKLIIILIINTFFVLIINNTRLKAIV